MRQQQSVHIYCIHVEIVHKIHDVHARIKAIGAAEGVLIVELHVAVNGQCGKIPFDGVE